jgi:hypothetical protein
MGAAKYKHVVCFPQAHPGCADEHRAQFEAPFADESGVVYLPDAADRTEALEDRDHSAFDTSAWRP